MTLSLVLLQPDRQAEVDRIDSFNLSVRADNQHIFVLAGHRHRIAVIVKEGERKMLAGIGPFDVLVNGAVQPIEELVRIVLTGFLKRARD